MPDRTVFRSLANVGIAGNACLNRITSAPNATDAAAIRAFAGITALLEQTVSGMIAPQSPEDPMRTAAAIDGVSVIVMEHPDHFPRSRNPEKFRRYLAPVPGKIAKQSTFTKQGEYA
jgi:hypothetical protein